MDTSSELIHSVLPIFMVTTLGTSVVTIGVIEGAAEATAAITTRYLLGKIGADEDHIAVLAATADQPIGVITDEPAAAEDPTDVELLGVSNRTQRMVAGEAIDEGESVYATAAGKVVTAGLIDEMHLAVSPVLLGKGESLFGELDMPALGYRVTRHVGSDAATHVFIAREA